MPKSVHQMSRLYIHYIYFFLYFARCNYRRQLSEILAGTLYCRVKGQGQQTISNTKGRAILEQIQSIAYCDS